jgi:hypothetical protein
VNLVANARLWWVSYNKFGRVRSWRCGEDDETTMNVVWVIAMNVVCVIAMNVVCVIAMNVVWVIRMNVVCIIAMNVVCDIAMNVVWVTRMNVVCSFKLKGWSPSQTCHKLPCRIQNRVWEWDCERTCPLCTKARENWSPHCPSSKSPEIGSLNIFRIWPWIWSQKYSVRPNVVQFLLNKYKKGAGFSLHSLIHLITRVMRGSVLLEGPEAADFDNPLIRV